MGEGERWKERGRERRKRERERRERERKRRERERERGVLTEPLKAGDKDADVRGGALLYELRRYNTGLNKSHSRTFISDFSALSAIPFNNAYKRFYRVHLISPFPYITPAR